MRVSGQIALSSRLVGHVVRRQGRPARHIRRAPGHAQLGRGGGCRPRYRRCVRPGRRLVHVRHADGERQRVRVFVTVVGSDGERVVDGLGLKVQRQPGHQLACGAVEREGAGVRAAQGVIDGISIRVGSRDGLPDRCARRSVLCHGARGVSALTELRWRVVVRYGHQCRAITERDIAAGLTGASGLSAGGHNYLVEDYQEALQVFVLHVVEDHNTDAGLCLPGLKCDCAGAGRVFMSLYMRLRGHRLALRLSSGSDSGLWFRPAGGPRHGDRSAHRRGETDRQTHGGTFRNRCTRLPH